MRPIRTLAVAAGLGIPLQAVLGGLTVLTKLDPRLVSLHMLLPVTIISLCFVMVHRTYDTSAVAVSRAVRRLVLAIVATRPAVAWRILLYAVFTVLTGLVLWPVAHTGWLYPLVEHVPRCGVRRRGP